jgi:hypothetical protein
MSEGRLHRSSDTPDSAAGCAGSSLSPDRPQVPGSLTLALHLGDRMACEASPHRGRQGGAILPPGGCQEICVNGNRQRGKKSQ